MKISLVTTVISIFGTIFCSPINDENGPKSSEWRLNIIHTNDMHGRFIETSGGEAALPCKGHDGGSGKCYGGFARISTLIKQIRGRARELNQSTLYLDAGDIFDGTALFEKYTDNITYTLFNLLHANATVLGNHEFVKDLDNLTSFISHLTFPVLSCNLDLSHERLRNLTNLHKSVVLDVDGHQVGIVGYTFNKTYFPGVHFYDELDSIKTEVTKMKDQNVSIIIGLSHSGYNYDKYVASHVDDIDLIISGHSHSLLTNDKPLGTNILSQLVEGPYPTKVSKMVNGKERNVYIVAAYAYTKYLGNLSVVFDREGEVQEIEGRAILVDENIEKDQAILDALENYPGDKINTTVIGYTRVPLVGNFAACRGGECTLGDVVADALIEYNINKTASTKNWTDAAIALVHSGLIADGMSNIISIRNPIIEENLKLSLSKVNEICKLDLTGREIRNQLEYAVSKLSNHQLSEFSYLFDQVSGIKVKYNLSEPVGSRIVPESLFARCADCETPRYEKIVDDKVYRVIANSALAVGYYELSKWGKKPLIRLDPSKDVFVDEAVRWYLKNRSPVHPESGERITFV